MENEDEVVTVVLAIVIGLAAGLLGALLGVGGGIIMVPAFVYLLKMDMKAAIVTSMAVILVTAISATLNNATDRDSLIDWRVVAFTGTAAAVAAWIGSDLMRSLSNQTLTKAFGVVLILAGLRALLK